MATRADRTKTDRSASQDLKTAFLTRVYAFWVVALLVCVLVSFVRTFWQGANLYTEWSFRFDDQPWTPPPTTPTRIFHRHFFGDFQLPMSYVGLKNPYQEHLVLPFGSAPIALSIFRILTFFPLKMAFVIFTLLTLFLIIRAFIVMVGPLDRSNKTVLLTLAIGFSLPIWMWFDRGWIGGFAIGSFALGVALLLKPVLSARDKFLIFTLFSIAPSFKSYLLLSVVLLLFIFSGEKRKTVLKALITCFTVNLFLSLWTPGGPLKVLANILQYAQFQSGSFDATWLHGGVGFDPFLLSIVGHYCRNSDVICSEKFRPYSNIAGVVWLLIVLYFCLSKYLDARLKLVFVFSTIQMTSPVAMAFTLMWVVFGLALVISAQSEKMGDMRYRFWAFLLILINLPLPFTRIFPWPFDTWQRIPPTLLLALPILGLVEIHRNKRQKSFDIVGS
jgi:hypothetical protein